MAFPQDTYDSYDSDETDFPSYDSDLGDPLSPSSSISSSSSSVAALSYFPSSPKLFSKNVAVIGVGYVGLHLVEVFGHLHNVTAFDISRQRIQDLRPQLQHLPLVKLTYDPQALAQQDYYLISVPTLLKEGTGEIDTSYIKAAIDTVAQYAGHTSTVVIESSVAVGMTRELLTPLMIAKNFRAGMSPERVDPGRKFPVAQDIPKVVSGLDDIVPGSLMAIESLYKTAFNRVVPVSSCEVAEMTKLYENCQRMINIAYANEMADACIPLGIDPFEVCRAAATKPFGYSNFTPSAGVGGHCIPVNPYYLLSTSDFPILNHATQTMAMRPSMIVSRMMRRVYIEFGMQPAKYHTLVVGVGFKPGQAVLSHSPGISMMTALKAKWKAEVAFMDPLVKEVPGFRKLQAEEWHSASLEEFHLIIVVINQPGVDTKVLQSLRVPIVHYCYERAA